MEMREGVAEGLSVEEMVRDWPVTISIRLSPHASAARAPLFVNGRRLAGADGAGEGGDGGEGGGGEDDDDDDDDRDPAMQPAAHAAHAPTARSRRQPVLARGAVALRHGDRVVVGFCAHLYCVVIPQEARRLQRIRRMRRQHGSGEKSTDEAEAEGVAGSACTSCD